jgi:hypothetical protein
MPSYDPQRSHTRRRVTDDEGPAPVDALLGPVPDAEPEPDRAPEPSPAPSEPLIIDLDQPAPVNVPRHRGRLVLFVLAAVSLVVQALLFLWWRRRRSAASTED